jgi:glutamate racemase
MPRHRPDVAKPAGHDAAASGGRGRATLVLACRAVDPRPIGMFDSGFGGLTVARAVIDLLPGEDLVYVGDTARYPYGPRPLDEVRAFAEQLTRHLVDVHDVKLVVVACNTAAAAALDHLAELVEVPVIGVIEPGSRSLVAATRSGRVGVIGTVGTVASGAYQQAVAEAAAASVPASGSGGPARDLDAGTPGEAAPAGPDVELTCAACPGFVEFVERGETDSDQVRVLAERLLAPVRDAGVDTLLLGCTHYPYLARTIADVMGREVVLVSSADETGFAVRARLEADDALAPPRRRPAVHRFASTGDTTWFRDLGRRLLGPELDHVEHVRLGPVPPGGRPGRAPARGPCPGTTP